MRPDCAMVLAAGLGTRMRPLTNDKPKSLVEVDGQTLIDRALDQLAKAGVKTAVINHHYKSEKLLSHLSARQSGLPALRFSDEKDELLETGGGIKKALPLFTSDPFFSINCDVIWTDGADNTLSRLAAHWDDEKMDGLLLMIPIGRARGHAGAGDFFLTDTRDMRDVGRLAWRGEAKQAPYVFAGIQLVSTRLYRDTPEGPFSNLRLWDRAIGEGRLFGLVHQGGWVDIGTPQGRDDAEAWLQQNRP
ncbi:MAG: nucleotidyltransferase family protein [Alphaproteobacteria bacterium]|nr:nucleotidyltransferase family protein [Alphaproteobacteria bacterium]